MKFHAVDRGSDTAGSLITTTSSAVAESSSKACPEGGDLLEAASACPEGAASSTQRCTARLGAAGGTGGRPPMLAQGLLLGRRLPRCSLGLRGHTPPRAPLPLRHRLRRNPDEEPLPPPPSYLPPPPLRGGHSSWPMPVRGEGRRGSHVWVRTPRRGDSLRNPALLQRDLPRRRQEGGRTAAARPEVGLRLRRRSGVAVASAATAAAAVVDPSPRSA